MSEEKINELYHRTLEIAVQYADDCGYAIVAEDDKLMRYRATLIPPTLRKRNLLCNEDKNEDFLIKAKGNTEWKSCKYLGSLFDTEKDIKRRKMLALNAMKDMTYIWKATCHRILSSEYSIHIFSLYSCQTQSYGQPQKQ